MKEKQRKNGITLIALVITIVVLLILAGVSIAMLGGEDGILKQTQKAKEEENKQTATETINLKITNIQIASYAEKTRMPTLQELADNLCEDDDMEYVFTESKKTAKLDKIYVKDKKSIFTKLKEYPYEFEINSSLQLASINGIKVAELPDNNDDTIVSMTKSELQELIKNEVSTQLGNNSSEATYITEAFADVNATKNQTNVLESITLSAGKYVLVGYAYYRGTDLRYLVRFGDSSSSAYDRNGYVGMNVTSIVNVIEEQTFQFTLWPTDKDVTVGGWIKAIRIGD